MTTFVDLKSLPVSDPMRTRPLIEIRAELRNNAGPSPWRAVGASWAIARLAFNDLGGAWLQYADWRAQIDSGPS